MMLSTYALIENIENLKPDFIMQHYDQLFLLYL